MDVILLEDVKTLGKKGQIVKINDGYARNYVLPKKLGIEATAKNLNDLKLARKREEKEAAEELAAAKDAGIPVFGSEVEQVKNGCLAADGIDYVALGKQTGAMAAKVLKGEAEASDMPYEACEGANLYINTEVASDLGITFPENYEADAAEVFETVTVE